MAFSLFDARDRPLIGPLLLPFVVPLFLQSAFRLLSRILFAHKSLPAPVMCLAIASTSAFPSAAGRVRNQRTRLAA